MVRVLVPENMQSVRLWRNRRRRERRPCHNDLDGEIVQPSCGSDFDVSRVGGVLSHNLEVFLKGVIKARTRPQNANVLTAETVFNVLYLHAYRRSCRSRPRHTSRKSGRRPGQPCRCVMSDLGARTYLSLMMTMMMILILLCC